MHSDYKIRSTIYNESGVHTAKEEATEFFSQLRMFLLETTSFMNTMRKVGYNDQFEIYSQDT